MKNESSDVYVLTKNCDHVMDGYRKKIMTGVFLVVG